MNIVGSSTRLRQTKTRQALQLIRVRALQRLIGWLQFDHDRGIAAYPAWNLQGRHPKVPSQLGHPSAPF